MIFCVSIFYFCLEPTVPEQLVGKDFHDYSHYYAIFSESNIFKLLDHSCIQSYFATITKHFDNSIWNDALQLLKILRTWITIWTNYFSSKYL